MRHPRDAWLLAAPLALVLGLTGAVPAHASHWIEVGGGGADGKVRIDTDSLRKLGRFTLVDIVTVYRTPLVNSHDITLDRFVQRTAIDCARHTFVAVTTTGYLRGQRVGASHETPDWMARAAPLPDDPISRRIYSIVCAAPAPTPKPKAAAPPG